MAKETTKSKELITKPKTGDLITQQFEEEAGVGLEGMTQQDFAIPFLAILQSNSPQLNRTEGAFIKGAMAGQIIHTVSNKLYDSVRVIPCAFNHRIVEWKPRGSGGGLVAQYERENTPTDTTANDRGQTIRANGNLLIATAYHYVIIMDDEMPPEPGIIAMSSTQLKKSKRWNSIMAALKLQGSNGPFTPPTYAYSYIMSTVGESNDKGNWFGWDIEQGELNRESDLIQICRVLAKSSRNISVGAMRTQQQEETI